MSRDKEEHDALFDVERDRNGKFTKGSSGNPLGKPKGTKSIASRASVKKLEEEGFDPIEELLKQYASAEAKGNEDLMFKITTRLLEYGYSKQPTMSEVKTEETSVFKITTTKKDGESDD